MQTTNMPLSSSLLPLSLRALLLVLLLGASEAHPGKIEGIDYASLAPRLISVRGTLHGRALSSISVVQGGEDGLSCSSNQISTINQAVNDAKALATAASSVLDVDGAENSDAYQQWFGTGS
jgi:hypothetical protein